MDEIEIRQKLFSRGVTLRYNLSEDEFKQAKKIQDMIVSSNTIWVRNQEELEILNGVSRSVSIEDLWIKNYTVSIQESYLIAHFLNEKLVNLQNLYLYSLQIQSLDFMCNVDLPNLRVLSLGSNKFNSIRPLLRGDFKKMESLWFGGNNVL